ncbi:MAG TPA: ribonuclease HI family protein [Burkholderiaceae bacterium]|jgi:ribonuclease HI
MFEQLCAIAYKKERVLGRRLAKNMALSEEEALKQVLIKAASNRSLEHLISERLQTTENGIAKLAERRQQQAEALAKRRASTQPDPSAWLAWFDGATSPNPGKMGIGGLLKDPDGRIVEISFGAGHGDSNEAEYLALIAVLEEAVRIQPDKLMVYGDSRVVIDEMNGVTYIGANNLKGVSEQAKRLIAQLNAVSLHWTPRKKNAAADALSQRGLLT